MERAGLDALPIVATTTFFVGATIAFLGTDLLAQFGAQIFSVELVGIGVLREFGVLVTAIILAGRSASSFAAEIGAMRMNQEVDAMQVMGVDPFEALIIPRFHSASGHDAAADLRGHDRRAGRGRAGGLGGGGAVASLLPAADAGQCRRHPVLHRDRQDARHGHDHRRHRLPAGYGGGGRCGEPGTAGDHRGGPGPVRHHHRRRRLRPGVRRRSACERGGGRPRAPGRRGDGPSR